ncbi:uncharacterized protein RSE6_00585 [Rhynchosporium secalis]|uniref:Velvet domain-containing protein n=1 Tax=Rhynchosporium secalis TaxID=38038 RepID=A0A1E1LVM9_RHYSE|nr:uncharacterized protein RSE6_00585 [Rhynchosporium secalis]
MPGGPSNHQFEGATSTQVHGLSSQHCKLIIRQAPEKGKVSVGKEKGNRRPIDPPPMIQLKVSRQIDKHQNFLQSPYFFMTASLLSESDKDKLPAAAGPGGASLAGTLVSSLHRLKDAEMVDGAFFIFGDLSIKHEGRFRLQFTLYEMRQDECAFVSLVVSNSFPVLSGKNFAGMTESTSLTRHFSEQGVRLRIRKEPRSLLRKRGPSHDDYQPRHYKYNRQSASGGDRQSMVASYAQEHQQRDQEEQIGYHSQQSSWEQRPIPSRHFSQSSTTSIHASTDGSYDDQQPAKRPRTGSDQHQTSTAFDQVHQSPLDMSSFPLRPFPGSQQIYTGYGSSQPTPYSSYSYAQSPQTANSSRPYHFANRTGGAGVAPLFDASVARSPQEAQFPPHPQTLRYGPMDSLSYNAPQPLSSTLRHGNSHHSPHTIAIGSDPPVYPAQGTYGMPPLFSRDSGAPAPILARRQDYQAYSGARTNPNTSADNFSTGLYPQP